MKCSFCGKTIKKKNYYLFDRRKRELILACYKCGKKLKKKQDKEFNKLAKDYEESK